MLMYTNVTPDTTKCEECKWVISNMKTESKETFYCGFSHSWQPREINGQKITCGIFKAKEADWDI